MPRVRNPLDVTSKVAHLCQGEDSRALDNICGVLMESLGCQVVSVYSCLKDGYLMVANRGFGKEHVDNLILKKGRGLVHHIVSTNKTLCLNDATTHPSFYYVQGLGEEKFHGFIGTPIRRTGKVIGSLNVQYTKTYDSSLDDIALVETISQQIAQLIQIKKKKILPKDVNVTGRGVTSGHFCGSVVKRLSFEDTSSADFGPGAGYKVEKARLQEAHYKSQLFLEELRDSSNTKEMSEILGAHLMMLRDPMLLEKEEHHLKDNASAEQAVTLASMEIAEMFKELSDPYMQQRAIDVIDVGRRVFHSLQPSEDLKTKKKVEKAVYMVHQLPPSVLIEEGPLLYGALVLVEENMYSHIIILAKSMGIPSVIISRDQMMALMEAETVFVDGESGLISPDPTSVWVEEYTKSRALPSEKEVAKLPSCRTRNGVPITLGMNGGFVRDMKNLPTWIPEIGLFRTEFQFFTSPKLPTEEELTAQYTEILKSAGNRPTTLRILDAGADKQPPCLHFVHEDNPVLGDRSIRFLLKNSDIIFSQLRAMLKAQAATQGHLRILIPMVTVYEEVSRIRDHVVKVIRDLRREGIQVKLPPIGAMVEVPSSIHLISKISPMVDFFCVGTNDLLQYFIAVDRTNTLVQYLYKWHHPSFLMSLREIVEASQKAERPVSICGEMAGEMWGSLILLALGFRNLSMDRQVLYRHHELIRHCSTKSLERLVDRLLQYNTGLEILEQLQLFLDKWSLPPKLKEVLQTELNSMINPS